MSGTVSTLLASLARATEAYPRERKLLVVPSPAHGREMLQALARGGVAWIGWEPRTPRQLALDLARPGLDADGVGIADEFDVVRLADEAMDTVAAAGGAAAETLASPGFRNAAHRALRALRAGGIPPAALRAALPSPALAALAEVLAAYERGLGAAARTDGAGVLRRACDALDAGTASLPAGRFFLAPGLDAAGLAGELLGKLRAATGAGVLEADPVIGLDAPAATLWRPAATPASRLSWLHAPGEAPAGSAEPEIAFFAAATPADEVREVLRRIVARGLRWDQVEIVATDPFTYGPTLDALARRLEIPVTHARGLSSERTRVGRAVAAYLQWVSEGFPADRLRTLLESGDLAPPEEAGVSGAALAGRLRRLRIGWGRDRYLPAVERALRSLEEPQRADDETDGEEREAQRARDREQLRALHAMLTRILAAAPATPDRLRAERVRTTPAAVAAGLLAFLEFVPVAGDEVEATTRMQVRARLERAQQTLLRETGWDAAVSALRTHLQMMVAAQQAGGAGSWTSAGGALHLSDVSSGGLCGRPVTFVVGLDATRTTSAGAVDPLLPDRMRRALNEAAGGELPALPAAAERVAGERHALAAMLARLRGEVVLSYSAWDAAEGRAVSPSADLLQAFRLECHDPNLAYSELHGHLHALACAVPASDAGCIDASDVWMHRLAAGGALRDGRTAVREAFADLGRGLLAREHRTGPITTEYHGRIDPSAAREAIEEMTFSPSRLEALGSCPRRFFYRYLLRLRPGDEPGWDPESWLGPAERGTLLHRVYERTLQEARALGICLDDGAAEGLALQILEAEAVGAREQVPPPSERIFDGEMEMLRGDVRVFAELVRAAPPAWVHTELEFPGEGGEVVLDLGELRIRLQGKIDRVDQRGPGRYVVVDYKTGSARRYRANLPFAGGRRIQHVVYLHAVEQMLGGDGEAMEYHFPTVGGESRVVRFRREDVERGRDVLRAMLGCALEGLFVATDDPDDCKFCDFAAVCRAHANDYGKVTCEVAAWSKTSGMELEEYLHLRTLRGIDG
jgi:ATP-dependent helicase/nuclease subunit B